MSVCLVIRTTEEHVENFKFIICAKFKYPGVLRFEVTVSFEKKLDRQTYTGEHFYPREERCLGFH